MKSRTDTQPREAGLVLRHSKDKTYGFIKPDRTSLGKDIFFHLRCLAEKGPLPNIGQRVQFRVVQTLKGLEATKVCVEEEVNIENNTWVRGNTCRFISSVERDISRVSAANE